MKVYLVHSDDGGLMGIYSSAKKAAYIAARFMEDHAQEKGDPLFRVSSTAHTFDNVKDATDAVASQLRKTVYLSIDHDNWGFLRLEA